MKPHDEAALRAAQLHSVRTSLQRAFLAGAEYAQKENQSLEEDFKAVCRNEVECLKELDEVSARERELRAEVARLKSVPAYDTGTHEEGVKHVRVIEYSAYEELKTLVTELQQKVQYLELMMDIDDDLD